MANQYTGVRKSTPLEIAETQNERMQAENRNLTAAVTELLDMLAAVWKENQSPDIARLLIQHGVTAAYGAEYTTPRKLDEARAENGRLRAELDEARPILECLADMHRVYQDAIPDYDDVPDNKHIHDCLAHGHIRKAAEILDLAAAKSNLCSICGSRAMSKTERGSDVCLECGWVQKAKDMTA